MKETKVKEQVQQATTVYCVSDYWNESELLLVTTNYGEIHTVVLEHVQERHPMAVVTEHEVDCVYIGYPGASGLASMDYEYYNIMTYQI